MNKDYFFSKQDISCTHYEKQNAKCSEDNLSLILSILNALKIKIENVYQIKVISIFDVYS